MDFIFVVVVVSAGEKKDKKKEKGANEVTTCVYMFPNGDKYGK